jgi:hypothetical protein
MSHLNSNRCKPAAAAVLVILLACLGLAACGSSSSSSTSTSTTATTATSASATTGTGAKGPNAGRFAAMRECLQKNGITLPQRTPGQRRPPGGAGGFLGGGTGAGTQLPKGVTRAQYEAALKKCGGGNVAGRGGGARFNSSAFKTALAQFATCLRQNGVDVPAPNTSGKGPVFDTKGIDTASAQFKTAETKCQSVLSAAFRHGRGAGTSGAPSGGGAAPSGGGAAPPAG